jgi:hypothetical protein
MKRDIEGKEFRLIRSKIGAIFRGLSFQKSQKAYKRMGFVRCVVEERNDCALERVGRRANDRALGFLQVLLEEAKACPG